MADLTPQQIATANAGLNTATAYTPQQMAAANTTGIGAGSLDPSINSSNLSSSGSPSYSQPASTPGYNISTLTPNPLVATDAEKTESGLSTRIQAINDQLVGKDAYQTQQDTAAGVDKIQGAIQDNTNAVQQLQAQAAIATQNAEGRGGLTFGLNAQEAQINRTQAVQALTLSATSAALNNNLVHAQQLANAAVAQKYGPLEAEQKAKMANLELIKNDPATSLADKNRATAALAQQTAITAQIASQKQAQTDVLKIATDAATKASQFTPTTQYPTLSAALNAITNAPNQATALQIAASSGLTGSSTGTWGTAYSLGGDIVQKNSVTGEIRSAVSNATSAPGSTSTTIKKGSLSSAQFVQNALTAQNIKYSTDAQGNAVLTNASGQTWTAPAGTIPVLLNATGQYGSIPLSEFNTAIYTKL